jgi:hypothetical protein
MPTLKQAMDAFVLSKEYDGATISRCAFWVDQLGQRELSEITPMRSIKP